MNVYEEYLMVKEASRGRRAAITGGGALVGAGAGALKTGLEGAGIGALYGAGKASLKNSKLKKEFEREHGRAMNEDEKRDLLNSVGGSAKRYAKKGAKIGAGTGAALYGALGGAGGHLIGKDLYPKDKK